MSISFKTVNLALIALGMAAFTTTAQADYTDDCITFSSAKSFKLEATKKWDGILWTSTDKTNWTEWNGAQVSAAKLGSTYNLYVRGNTANTKITVGYQWELTASTGIACSGNIETLRGATGNNPSPTQMAKECYHGMFRGCTSLTSAPALPATTLADNCYDYMFADCTSLTSAPALPATTLATYCYTYMFFNCTALKSAPAFLPATTLAENCYDYMFAGCRSLTNAPALPATTLTSGCYRSMFGGCRSLTKAPVLPATALARACYSSMFSGTALTEAPSLPATTLAEYCYKSMFYHCTSLTNAPALPATTLAERCYYQMFYDCAALEVNTTVPGKEWKISASSTSAANWGTDMFKGSGGTLQGQPGLNTTYYIKSALPPTQNDDCITFSSTAWFTLTVYESSKHWDGVLWTSTDKINWTVWDGTKRSAAQTDGMYNLYVRGNTSNTTVTYGWGYWWFTGSAGIACTGNIETLRGATGNNPSPTPMADSCYGDLFSGCTLLTCAPDLPATTLAKSCYSYMFNECWSLTNAPALPATTLEQSCYSSMFWGCSALATAPALPATTLAASCYDHMFYNCRSLTSAPALPATTLASGCYSEMFRYCDALTAAPALPATTLADKCYYQMFYCCEALEVNATKPGKEWKIPATSTVAKDWGSGMFSGTKGTLQGQPELNTTYYIASAPQPVEPGGEIVVPEGKAEAKAAEINSDPTVKVQYLKAPEGVETTADYLGCFDAVATSGSTVAFVLNENGTNEVVEATEAVNAAALDTVFSEESTMTIDKPLVGFYYSLKQGGDLSVGAKADLNKLGGRDTINFELTKGPLQYFYQSLVTPTPVPSK